MADSNGLAGKCLSLDMRRYAMAMELAAVLKPLAAAIRSGR